MNGKVFAIADLSMQPVCNLPDTPSRVRLFTMVVQLLVMSNWLQLDITTNRIAIANATIENSIPEGAMQRRVSILAESRGTNHVMGSLMGTRSQLCVLLQHYTNVFSDPAHTGPTRHAKSVPRHHTRAQHTPHLRHSSGSTVPHRAVI